MVDAQQILRSVMAADALSGKNGFEAFSSLLSARQYLSIYREMESLGLLPESPVLDWGCGDGHFSYALRKMGYRVTGYKFHGECEVGPFLRENGGELLEADKSEPVNLPFEAGGFACVCSIGVLEHVREVGGDEAASLREIHRILTRDGVFFCCHFPNRGSLVEYVIRKFFPNRYHHQYLYNRGEIENLLAKSGFRLEKIFRYGVLPKNIFKNLPGIFSNHSVFVSFYFILDRALETLFPGLAQNWFFLARKIKSSS